LISSKQAEKVAKATVQIIAESSAGSGFHFLKPGVIVTNHHVVEDASVVTAIDRWSSNNFRFLRQKKTTM